MFIAISNVAAVKIAEFNVGFYKFTAPAVVLIFAVTFLITDIVNEKFGRKETHKMIFIAFITQVIMSLFIWLTIKIPPAPFWQNQQAYESLFGLVPRIVFASWVAFLISENTDAIIFDKFKKFTKGKHLWARNIFSTLPALTIDSFIFVPLAFYGLFPVWPIILGQLFTKYLVGIIDIPFMYLNRKVMYSKLKWLKS